MASSFAAAICKARERLTTHRTPQGVLLTLGTVERLIRAAEKLMEPQPEPQPEPPKSQLPRLLQEYGELLLEHDVDPMHTGEVWKRLLAVREAIGGECRRLVRVEP